MNKKMLFGLVSIVFRCYLLLKEEISPTIAVGDFDSVTDQEWEFIRNHVKHLKQVQPEKDDKRYGISSFMGYGAKAFDYSNFCRNGGKVRSFFTNIFMLTKDVYLSVDTTIEMIDTTKYYFGT